MKISRNWLENYIISNKSNKNLSEMFTQLGLECTVDEIIFNLENVVVGKVLSCKKHPDADRLKVCEIETINGIFQVVCGASNVRTGMLGIFAHIDSYIPGTKIKLKKSMYDICLISEQGLGYGDSFRTIGYEKGASNIVKFTIKFCNKK